MAEYFGAGYEQFVESFGKVRERAGRMGLELNPISHLTNTHRAFLLTEYVREQRPELLDKIQHALFRAYFVQGQNLAEDRVLLAVCQEVGLEPSALAESARYEERVATAQAEALQYGVTGAPTMIINDQYKLVGALPYERMREILTQIARETDS